MEQDESDGGSEAEAGGHEVDGDEDEGGKVYGCYLAPISPAVLSGSVDNLFRFNLEDLGRFVMTNTWLGGDTCLRNYHSRTTKSCYFEIFEWVSSALPIVDIKGILTGEDEEMSDAVSATLAQDGIVYKIVVGDEKCYLRKPSPRVVSDSLRDTLLGNRYNAGVAVVQKCWIEGDAALRSAITFGSIGVALEAAKLVKPFTTTSR